MPLEADNGYLTVCILSSKQNKKKKKKKIKSVFGIYAWAKPCL